MHLQFNYFTCVLLVSIYTIRYDRRD